MIIKHTNSIFRFKNMPRFLILFFLSCVLFIFDVYPAPSNGTRFPSQGSIESGYEYNNMFKSKLRNSFGDLSAGENFYKLSLGFFDWLSLDGALGIGDVAQDDGKLPKLFYNSGFSGGYGFRVRAFQKKEWSTRLILGFQHICVHPEARNIDDDKYEVILDDWQASAILAKDFDRITVYAGMKGSDCQLIYKLNGYDRKRISSENHIGLITGLELYLFNKKARLCVEGRFFDENALSASVSWIF